MIALIFGVILYLEVLSDPSSWQIYWSIITNNSDRECSKILCTFL